MGHDAQTDEAIPNSRPKSRFPHFFADFLSDKNIS
jgi:hypothetical protein